MSDSDGGAGEDPLAAAEELEPEELAELFEALSNPRRIRLLHHLAEPQYLREIASAFGLSRQAVHHHLDRLVETGFLERRSGSRESGPVTEYVLVPEVLALVHEGVERVSRVPGARRDRPDRTRGGSDHPASSSPPDRGLWVVHGIDAGTRLSLVGDEGPWVVGRDPTCDLVLEGDPFASARHAEVWPEGTGHRVGDLASTNGTFVNGRRLDRREDAALDHGDVVGVGRSLLLYQDR